MFLHIPGDIHLLCLQAPKVSCFLHAGFLKLAVGPPISCIYPLKSSYLVISSASSTIESSLLLVTILPWWKVIAQNEQFPEHPLELTKLNLTSSIAAIPPSFS